MGKVGKAVLGIAIGTAGVLLAPVTGGASLALVGVGLNMTTRAVFGTPKLDMSQATIKQTVMSPVATLPVVYGMTKVGARIVDIRVDTTNRDQLYVVAAFCHGSIDGRGVEAIGRIWFDDKLAFDAAGTVQAAFKKDGNAKATVVKYLGTSTQTADSSLTTAFSSVWNSTMRGRGVAYCVFKLTLESDVYKGIPSISAEIQGAKPLDPRQTSAPTYTYATNPVVQALDYLLDPIYGYGAGRKVQLASTAVSNSGFSSFSAANVVDGNVDTVAWSASTATGGLATVSFDFGAALELDRLDLFVVRGGTHAGQYLVQYSDNGSSYTSVPGLTVAPTAEFRNTFRWVSSSVGAHRYWRLYLNNTPGTTGFIMGAEWYETAIDYASFATLANTVDATTSVPPTTESSYKVATAAPTLGPLELTIAGHGWSNGDLISLELATGYAISGLKNATDNTPVERATYTATSVDANNIRLSVTATGTYVSSSIRAAKCVTEALYASNGALIGDGPEAKYAALTQLLNTFRGRLVYQNGRYRVFQKTSGMSAAVAFTDDDIRQVRFITPGSRERFNQATAQYVDPARDYSPDERQFPRPDRTNTYLAADGNMLSVLTTSFPFVTSACQVDRLLQVLVRESRSGITVEITVGERGLLAQIGDVVSLTYATPGWNAKLFWVESVTVPPDTGEPTLLLMEYDANAYVLDGSQLRASAPATDLPDALARPADPTGLTLAAGNNELLIQPNGEFIPRIRVTWTDSTNVFVEYYEIQARLNGATLWDTWGRVPKTVQEFFIGPVNVFDSWDVRIRAVTTLGITSDWVSSTISIAPQTRVPALGIVDFFDDYPGTRWSNTGTGGSSVVAANPDSQYGGKVLVLTASRTGEWVPYIPFDVLMMYAIRGRVRCIVPASSGSSQDFFLGFKCYDNALNLLSTLGAGSGNSVIGAAANFQVIAAGFAWTDIAGYIRGWNGSWYAPGASVLTNSGFNGYTAANVGDNSPTAVAFHSDTATAGSTLTIDLGSSNDKAFIRAKIYLNAGSGVAQYKVQYSDNGSSWSDVTFRSGATTWTPSAAGWNEIDWGYSNAGSAKHRYWRLYLNNTPGGGPDVTEFQLLELLDTGVSAGPFTDPMAPGTVPPGTAYIRPYFQARGGTLAGWANDCVHELDAVEMPVAAGSTALV